MKGKYFIDSNIFVYAFDSSSPKKREVANQLISNAITKRRGCISYQVVQEVSNVALRKFEKNFTLEQLETYCLRVLFPLNAVQSSDRLVLEALRISNRYHFSFYDSLIISSALAAKCQILYSEDLQHLQKIETLQIVNPFI